MKLCKHCQLAFETGHEFEHPGLCCDCYDLSWGMSLEDLNKERANKGWKPITKEWPKSA